MNFTKIYTGFCLGWILVGFLTLSLEAQNPFEIQSRLPDSIQVEYIQSPGIKTSGETTLFTNPFDVSHERIETNPQFNSPPPSIITEINRFING